MEKELTKGLDNLTKLLGGELVSGVVEFPIDEKVKNYIKIIEDVKDKIKKSNYKVVKDYPCQETGKHCFSILRKN